MDEGGNADTVLDFSGGEYHGTINGAGWVDGRLGYPGDKALEFASGDYVEVNHPDSGLYLAYLSVECWVYPTVSFSIQSILSLGDGENEGWWLGTDSFNHFQVKIYTSSGGYTATAPDSYSLNTWYHLAFTYDGSSLVLYVDGVPKISTTSPTGEITYATSPPLLFSDSTSTFQGRIDMVRITSGALSEDTIFAHAIPTYLIFYTRDGDAVTTDTDTEEIPATGWSPVYIYGNEDYAELEIIRWGDNFNDNIFSSTLWSKWGESANVQEVNQRLEVNVTTDTSGVTSLKTVGTQFSLSHYITPITGKAISEITNLDTGPLQEGVTGDTGYRVLFENGEVYFQYLNDGVVEDTTFLGNYTSGERYLVSWNRWDVGGNQGLSAEVSGLSKVNVTSPDYNPSYFSLHTNGEAYFDGVKVKPISRYLQYRVYLRTVDTFHSPVLNEVRITFEPVSGDANEPETYISLPLKDNRDTDLFRIKYIDNQVTYCFGSPHQSPIVIRGTSTDDESGVDYVEISWGKRPQGGEWPASYTDYTWSSWEIVENTSDSGDYSTWQYLLNMDDLDEAGYLIRVRAVDNTGNEEILPTDATKTIEVRETDGGDSSLVNIMKDITPPRVVWETGYYPQIALSWYGGSSAEIRDIDNRDSGFIEINADFNGDSIPDTWLISRTPSFKLWVEDKNPSGSVNDCSGLNETALSDSPPQYRYSKDGSTYLAWSDSITLDTPFEGAVHPDKKFLEIDNIPFNQESKIQNLIAIRVYDRAGNEMILSDTALAIDITPMRTSIFSTSASSSSPSASFSWTSYDPYTQAEPPEETQVSDTYLVRWRLVNYATSDWEDQNPGNYGFVDGETNLTTSYSDLKKGKTYVFQVRYMDKAGNYETQETWGIGGNTYYWTIESDTPDVYIIQGPAGISTSDTAYFKWRSMGAPTETQECDIYLDGELQTYDSWSGSNGVYEGEYTASSLSSGSHTFSVEVYYTSTPVSSDTAIRTWVYRSIEENPRSYYPLPPRKFWLWEEGD